MQRWLFPVHPQFNITHIYGKSRASTLIKWEAFISACFDTSHLIPAPVVQVNAYSIYWEHLMAKKSFNYGVTFVNARLSVRDKKDVEAWIAKQDWLSTEFVANMIADGYKCTFSYDDNNDCVIYSMTGKEDQTHNAKKCLVTRAATLEDAVMVAAYKHIVMFDQGDWGEGDGAQQAWG